MNRKEFDKMFGPVIFSYADQQAEEDRMLWDVTLYTLHGVNWVSNAVYEWLGAFDDQDHFVANYRDMEYEAVRAFDKSKEKELVEFTYRSRRFWMMNSETGARMIMFPEDYRLLG